MTPFKPFSPDVTMGGWQSGDDIPDRYYDLVSDGQDRDADPHTRRLDDVEHLAAAMDPGSTAGVIVYENVWAAPFASAARRSGGQLIANGRIPIQAIIASIEADQATATVGD